MPGWCLVAGSRFFRCIGGNLTRNAVSSAPLLFLCFSRALSPARLPALCACEWACRVCGPVHASPPLMRACHLPGLAKPLRP